MNVGLFLLSFVLIFAGSDLFTNGVEWLGRKLNLSEGVVGSVVAAVGTALPETFIPLIAIFVVGGTSGSDVGVGAILGAVFMLSTFAMFVTGLFIFIFKNRREKGTFLTVSSRARKRDLGFFLGAYSIAIAVLFIPNETIKMLTAPLFLAIYFAYLITVFRGESTCSLDALVPLRLSALFARLRRGSVIRNPPLLSTVAQVLLAVAFIVAGARLFVNEIVSLAMSLNVDAVLLSLIIAPIATELPEMLNSILWIRQGKDELALGNITGAIVFQSCILVAIGTAFTPWTFDALPAVSAALALIAGLVLFAQSAKGRLGPRSLIMNGLFYALFIGIILAFT